MRAKTAVTALLLLFVGGSVAYLVVGGSSPPEDGNPATTPTSVAPPEPEVAAPAHKVIAYYFHGTQRCKTCLTIERLAQEALTAQFADALANGALEWHSINTDDPAHEHFVADYALVTSSLVLVDVREGAQPVWSKLDRVWQLVHDEPAFKGYVVSEVLAHLEPDA